MNFDDLEDRFRSVAGIQAMDATDKFFFLNSLNIRAKDAWTRANWPELISIQSYSVGTQGEYAKATATISNDILNVYDKSPYSDISALSIFYTLIDGRIVLDPKYPQASVYVLSRQAFTPYTDASTNIPDFLQSYLLSAILADFFRGDSQYDKAQVEESRAEEFLLKQIDRVEKQQQQNTPLVGSYSNTITRQIYQTN